ncbi:MAG TPA: biotin--[acetyl-CoA-carboxylase] ligase [Jatrophihabitans sp.]|nr:biotin--[acetyl-CoA-carboxylase] ligase [Jatrophihabitans sp.]
MTEQLRTPLDGDRVERDAVGGWRLTVLASTGSTNTDLLAAAATGAPDRSVLAAELQTGGRGRLDRGWTSPSQAGLTFSVLLRPAVPAPSWGWLPLLAGLTLRRTIGGDAALKWPNDLLLGPDDGKVAGILAQTGKGAVVIGIGLNVTLTASELPVPTATSLALQGVEQLDRTALLAGFLTELDAVLGRWQGSGGDAEASGLAAEYRDGCRTIGQQVSVQLPDRTVTGRVLDVDPAGRLVLQPDDGGPGMPIAAGDVTHTRPISR